MVETKKKKKKKKPRTERRYVPAATSTPTTTAGAGMVGALLLGVGVYGQWLRDGWTQSGPMEHSQWLVAGGAAVLAGALWFADAGAHPVRVGDAGIAIEKGNELLRLAWCDVESIRLHGGQLVIQGTTTLAIPLHAHAAAIARILSECVQRVPDVLEVRESERRLLPEARDDDGEDLVIEGIQIAGRHCAESDKPIAFERDARLCPRCGEVYHESHVPAECVTCDAPLAGRAVAP